MAKHRKPNYVRGYAKFAALVTTICATAYITVPYWTI